ncbi:MAG: endonuclease/exonuclease/phosphatase family protein [Planctomycetota bacterium]
MLILFAACVIVFLVTVWARSRFGEPPNEVELVIGSLAGHQATSNKNALKIVSWNIGYAGLGRDADFVMDGGKSVRPTSQSGVRHNIAAISSWLEQSQADILLLQETAGPCLATCNIDLRKRLEQTLGHYQSVHVELMRTRGLPRRLRLDVGSSLFSRIHIHAAQAKHLGSEFYLGGFLRRDSRLVISRHKLRDGSQLVIAAVHLSAFQEEARQSQLSALKEFMENEVARGNHVIAGGDFNQRLVDTDLSHSTDPQFLFWVSDFPSKELGPSLKTVADPTVPSVRTLHQPFVPGENYQCVVDGFIVSQSIEVVGIKNHDLQFEHTDHQPVEIDIRLISECV